MDPNTVLETIRRLIKEIQEPEWDMDFMTAVDLADSIESLDNWLTKMNGCLPEDWKNANKE